MSAARLGDLHGEVASRGLPRGGRDVKLLAIGS
jgi:hypothetical protein